jgi:hypothetical protein
MPNNDHLEKFIRNHAGEFDTRTPGPEVLSRILRQMEKGETGKKKGIWISMRYSRATAACLVILAGAAVFWITRPEQTPVPAITAQTNTPATTITAPAKELPETNLLPEHVEPATGDITPAFHKADGKREIIFTGLRNMDAPSQRMIAVSKAYQLVNIDHDIIDALTKTLNSDPNTNVRLAALEALGKFHREPYVKKKLVGSLKKQNDPMVQIALIELLTNMREKSILQELNKIVNDTRTMEAVKDHAYSSIFTLKS